MSWFQSSWPTLKKILFKIDPETIHDLSQNLVNAAGHLRIIPKDACHHPKTVFGMEFLNDTGLAAGLDKNAKLLRWLPGFGFGFCEVGTVTPLPQSGNAKPRLFRHPSDESLFNRMGFNNDGSEVVARRVRDARNHLPSSFRIGVNIGKNKTTPNEQAHLDYQKALIPFEGCVDFVVINVSSPNTPGLRSLQNKESLSQIVQSVQELNQSFSKPLPVLLKLAPELTEEAYIELIQNEQNWGLSGWVLTNTLQGNWQNNENLPGGWSGGKLTARSKEVLGLFKKHSSLRVVSVGGINSNDEIQARRNMGADLLEVYSGWVYRGPYWLRSFHQKQN